MERQSTLDINNFNVKSFIRNTVVIFLLICAYSGFSQNNFISITISDTILYAKSKKTDLIEVQLIIENETEDQYMIRELSELIPHTVQFFNFEDYCYERGTYGMKYVIQDSVGTFINDNSFLLCPSRKAPLVVKKRKKVKLEYVDSLTTNPEDINIILNMERNKYCSTFYLDFSTTRCRVNKIHPGVYSLFVVYRYYSNNGQDEDSYEQEQYLDSNLFEGCIMSNSVKLIIK